MSSSTRPTAAALIIGNEILSGRTADENIVVIARKLSEMGIDLSEVRVVPDVEARIVEALNALRRTYTYVLTTGGIGPTHDDITMAATAKAFGVPLVEDPQAISALEAYFTPAAMNPARRRMALVPQGARLVECAATAAPGACIENVFIFAGVPEIMESMLDAIADALARGPQTYVHTVSCSGLPESMIADELTALASRVPMIDIGSYPTFEAGKIGLSLVVRGEDAVKVKEAAEAISELIRAQGVEPEIREGY